MVIYVPSGQSRQLIGMPPLPAESYEGLDQSVRFVWERYVQMAGRDATANKGGR